MTAPKPIRVERVGEDGDILVAGTHDIDQARAAALDRLMATAGPARTYDVATEADRRWNACAGMTELAAIDSVAADLITHRWTP